MGCKALSKEKSRHDFIVIFYLSYVRTLFNILAQTKQMTNNQLSRQKPPEQKSLI